MSISDSPTHRIMVTPPFPFLTAWGGKAARSGLLIAVTVGDENIRCEVRLTNPHETAALIHPDQCEQQDKCQKHRESDLPHRPGPFALHPARLTVDDEAVAFTVIAISRCPDRQQDMLEGFIRVAGLDSVDALFVAADVAAHVHGDDTCHFLSRNVMAGAERDCI